MNKDLMEYEEQQEELSVGEIFSDDEDKSLAKEEKKAKKKAEKEAKKAVRKSNKVSKSDDVDDKASRDEEGTNSNEALDSEDSDIEAVNDKKSRFKNKKKKRKKKKSETKPEDINIVKELLSLIVYIGIVVLACFLIINFVGCRSLVDGSSMEPTLHNGDNLWVDKLSYTIGDPERFDVVVFYYDDETTYIKRIIGLPGETVRIDQNGNIFINEMLLKEEYGKEKILPSNIGRASQTILLGEDEYFVLGDNRNNSQDSRISSVGNVHRDSIVGKAIFRIYPLRDLGIVE